MQNIYFYLTPISIILVILEFLYCVIKKKNYFSFQDSFASLATAILNQLVNLIVAYLVFKTFGMLWDHRFFTIENSILNFTLLLLIIDFLFYWFHRLGHSINILWAAHMPHHSSEEFNLLVGLRASITQRLFSFTFFWPLVLFGFEPEVLYMATGVHLFLGYWHHTRVIGKLPKWYEAVFNSPSHHRVHHGINKKYLDKNFGEILIIWDRMFGTFVEEDENEEVEFGVFNHPKSWGVFDINFAFYKVLWKDFLAADTYWDKIRIWFMPLGWRPRNLKKRPGLPDIKKGQLAKFTTDMIGTKGYLISKLMVSTHLMVFTIDKNFPFDLSVKFFISATIILNIVTVTRYLAGKKVAFIYDLVSWVFILISIFEFLNTTSFKVAVILSFFAFIISSYKYFPRPSVFQTP